jgi:iron complex outermembrane receptor protein
MAMGWGNNVGSRSATRVVTIALLALLPVHSALGQQASDHDRSPLNVAQADRAISFDIPAQPLSQALMTLGRQAGLQVAVDSASVAGKTSAPLKGTMTADQALRQLLEGSGLTYRFTSPTTITVSGIAAPAPGVVQLDPVRVGGQTSASAAADTGFVPKRSSVASKIEMPLLSTPESISVVTQDQLKAQKPQTVSQALRYTPGITADYRGPVSRYDVLYSRGFGGFYLQYLDQMKMLASLGGYAIPQVDPYSLERIDVLRGPASALYGQQSPGGLVNLVSKRPPMEPLHEIELQAGSFNLLQAAFDFGGPLDDSGEWYYRVTGLARNSNTQVDFTKLQRFLLAPAVTWKPDPNTSLTVLANFQHDPSGGYFGFVPAQGTFLFNPNGKIPTGFYDGDPNFDWFQRTQRSFAYYLDHRFDDTWAVRQNFRYQNIAVNFGRVASNGFVPGSLTTLTRRVLTDAETLDGITNDNQLELKFKTGPLDHTMLFGLDFQWSVDDFQIGLGNAPTLSILTPVYYQQIQTPPITQNTRQTQKQLGLYAQELLKFGNLSVLLSGRQDWADSLTFNRLTNAVSWQSDKAFTGRVGVVYTFDAGVAPYFSYSTSFLPVTGVDFFNNPFQPTTAEQFEVGVKYQPPNFNAFATISAFSLTQQNVLTPDPNHIGFSTQTGEIRSRGIEVEVKANPIAGLNVMASYTYLDPVVTKSNGPDLGKRPVAVPSNMASFWGDYTIQKETLAGFGFGGGVRYIGPMAGDQANIYTIPGVTLFDASIFYDLSNLNPALQGVKFAVNATNLFDTEYVSSCINAPNTCYYGLRRTVMATLSRRW